MKGDEATVVNQRELLVIVLLSLATSIVLFLVIQVLQAPVQAHIFDTLVLEVPNQPLELLVAALEFQVEDEELVVLSQPLLLALGATLDKGFRLHIFSPNHAQLGHRDDGDGQVWRLVERDLISVDQDGLLVVHEVPPDE